MKVKYQGRDVEAIEVGFITRKEDFNEYQLSDGKILRLKTVLTDVIILENEKDEKGNQAYQFSFTMVNRIR